MNRAARRALERLLKRSGAHRPEDASGPTLEERLHRLEAENTALKARVKALDDGYDRLPGVKEHRLDWYVHVGGERVEIKAIPPAEWIRTLESLPSFLFTYAMERVAQQSEQLSDKVAEDVTDLAKRWLLACAAKPDELRLDRLTLLEAQHAVAHIAQLNGVTAYMRAWFRKRLAGVAATAPGGEELRNEAQQPTGDLTN